MKPVHFNLDQSLETLTTHSGLAFIGLLLSHTRVAKRLICHQLPGVHQPSVTHPDVLYPYLGVALSGQKQFRANRAFSGRPIFCQSHGNQAHALFPTLLQRLDLAAASSYDWQTILLEESADLLRSLEVPLTPVTVSERGKLKAWMPLAIARQDGMCCEERDGKRIYLGWMVWEDKKLVRPIRVIYQVIERTMEADGQMLLTPSIEVQVFFRRFNVRRRK